MVKIKTICRNSSDYSRQTSTEIQKIYRNTNPKLHSFQKAREYIRAFNAIKLDKLFSKPFLFSLSEPTDCVKSLAKNNFSLTDFASGTFDGQLLIYNLTNRKPIFNIKTQHDMIKEICYSENGENILTCGDDGMINVFNKKNLFVQRDKFYSKNENSVLDNSINNFPKKYEPILVYDNKGFLESIDHSYKDKMFGTAGNVVNIWSYERNSPIQTFKNVADGYLKIKFNCSESNIILSTGFDRSITLFDLRTQNPLKSVTLKNKSACACWNPQEPFNFTLGNEDSNCYTFDMRNLDKIRMIHKDHILSVLDIDYSPTGKEFVTGSFDKTIRIFKVDSGYSRDCFHTKRMQKVYSVLFTMDDKYVISGSDDNNIRVWKSVANESIKILNKREIENREYNKRLVEKYQYMPEIRKIINHKHIPKYVVNKKREIKIKKDSIKRKFKNKEKNSKPGTLDYVPERIEKIVKNGIVEKD